MASHLRLLCCVFGLLAVQELPGAEGVTFSLDPVETKVDGQATCGVLHCWEEVKPGSASITSISSLTVYKQEAGRRVTLTSLSRDKPIDNGTFGCIEVDGIWTPEKAEVNLSLVEKDDCTRVQFFCQVRYTDGQGNEKMSTAVVDGKDVTTHEQTEDTPEEIESVKWIVIQRRIWGDVSFYRNWDSYKNGFGSPDGDFWLGNNRIHALTSGERYELRVTLEYKGKIYYANYGSFSIDGEKDNYRLHIGNYKGNAGDSLRYHNNMMFSTFDKDNDVWNDSNCAKELDAGWWFNSCHKVNLNGKWGAEFGVMWESLTQYDPATFTEMKIREVIV